MKGQIVCCNWSVALKGNLEASIIWNATFVAVFHWHIFEFAECENAPFLAEFQMGSAMIILGNILIARLPTTT
ncbi:MAG: hypothetical protein BA866_00060 [Desulfobulbaceae bacterium S5133MH15]|nr:MAG: hypothetical protein BA866_00060 [Desulfobulbaceae bacterium S5133MH15]